MLLFFINTSKSKLVKSEGTIRIFMQEGKLHLDLQNAKSVSDHLSTTS